MTPPADIQTGVGETSQGLIPRRRAGASDGWLVLSK